jgi:chromosome partitioning protein
LGLGSNLKTETRKKASLPRRKLSFFLGEVAGGELSVASVEGARGRLLVIRGKIAENQGVLDVFEVAAHGGGMRIIALMNQKGGVGKTTTTVNLGAALAEAGKRVCLIDLDPQAHLTINYGVDPSPEQVSLYDVLVDERPIADAVQQVAERVDLVPSSIDLAAAEVELVSVMGREMILKKRLEAAGKKYDFILFDCPPSLGLLTINALAAAGEVIVPMQPHFLAMQGVAKLLETVHLVSKRMNPELKVGGIVLTMFDSQTKLSMEVVAELRRFIEEAAGKPLPWATARIFESKIRRNIKLAECPSFGQPVTAYDPASNGAADYRALAKEVMGMGEVPAAAPVVSVAAPAPVATPVAGGTMPAKPQAAAGPVAEKKPVAAKPAAPKPVAPKPAVVPSGVKPVAAAPKAPVVVAGSKPAADRPKVVVQPVAKKPQPPAPKPPAPAAAASAPHTGGKA